MWITTGVFLDQHKPCQRKLEMFFQLSFHWSYVVINNGICRLWLLLLDYNPIVSLSQLSLFVGTFLFSYFFSVISNRTQPPLEFQKSCWRILSVCCSTMISINTISQRVCILLKGALKVNEVGSSKMCVKCVVRARP